MIKQINDVEYVVLLCQRIEQPIGDLYTTSINWQTLKKIAYTFPRVLMGIDETGKEEYAGIQRHLSPERVKEISAYVNEDSAATFPSSIIINIPIEELDVVAVNPQFTISNNDDQNDIKCLNENQTINFEMPELFVFTFPYKEGVAQIIDGQHRMSGFESSSSDLKFDLPVTIFVDQLIPVQAEIFSTINGKQTRVTPSLVYDLFGLSQKRSPYRVANEIVRLLNESENSPLKNWIRILGKANKFYAGYITQSTVVKNLLLLICGNIKQAEEDKRLLAIGKKPELKTTLTSRETVFRDFFIDGEDEIIFKAITNFFKAVQTTYSEEWNNENSIIKKTVGFTALFKVFMFLAKRGREKDNLTYEFFQQELSNKADISFNDIQLSSKGVNQLYNRFNLQ
ncbi:MAG: DGQHR domain-containing protein [Vicingaceae bacterium]|nr:MAG: DGQHR domain-containing protein [Vicingaceae bacterium]